MLLLLLQAPPVPPPAAPLPSMLILVLLIVRLLCYRCYIRIEEFSLESAVAVNLFDEGQSPRAILTSDISSC